MITVSGLEKAYGTRTLFREVSFGLSSGRRVALVGGNGTGKTTLLEILVGLQPADAGEVHRPRGLRLGYLPQEPLGEPSGSVLDAVLGGVPELRPLERRLHELAERVAATTGDEHDRALAELGEAQHRFEDLDGYALEAEARRILAGLGFHPADSDRPLAEMSGGWRMRATLGALLLARPDVLVLDEPTNHLDTDSVAWLEDTLAAWAGALLFVSHDRDFIDAVANRVLELAGGTATEYVGGFAEFVVAREERLERARAAAAQQHKELERVERFIERFRYKATKARQVQSRVKTLAKLERIEAPDHSALVARFAFPPPRRSARVVAQLSGVDVGYDGVPVLRGVDLVVERGDKVAFVGPNGAGKTTLVRLLLGELDPLAGDVQLGANVDVASFAQHHIERLRPERTVLDELKAAAGPRLGARNPRTVAGSFGFPGELADRRVGDLSGGERTRLALACALVNPVNLLVLDEPTNHLDLPSCDVLEDALAAYPGTVILVTHDRHLIRNVATSLVEVRGGVARHHLGVDESVLRPPAPDGTAMNPPGRRRGPGEGAARAEGAARKEGRRVTAGERERRGAATKQLRARVARLERELTRAEADVAELQRRLADPALYDDPEQVREAATAHEAAKDQAAALTDAWVQAHTELDDAEARFAPPAP
ncbi:MAG: ABC-F family ATP-binding cassette domain-containing protein [Acidimicrobiales bacterium]|nr:ABC-F family ATP-binding cassette domain-containing protein [Acidimicrobiales bacterium]